MMKNTHRKMKDTHCPALARQKNSEMEHTMRMYESRRGIFKMPESIGISYGSMKEKTLYI